MSSATPCNVAAAAATTATSMSSRELAQLSREALMRQVLELQTRNSALSRELHSFVTRGSSSNNNTENVSTSSACRTRTRSAPPTSAYARHGSGGALYESSSDEGDMRPLRHHNTNNNTSTATRTSKLAAAATTRLAPPPPTYEVSLSVMVIDSGTALSMPMSALLDKNYTPDAREDDTPVVSSRWLRDDSASLSALRYSAGSCYDADARDTASPSATRLDDELLAAVNSTATTTTATTATRTSLQQATTTTSSSNHGRGSVYLTSEHAANILNNNNNNNSNSNCKARARVSLARTSDCAVHDSGNTNNNDDDEDDEPCPQDPRMHMTLRLPTTTTTATTQQQQAVVHVCGADDDDEQHTHQHVEDEAVPQTHAAVAVCSKPRARWSSGSVQRGSEQTTQQQPQLQRLLFRRDVSLDADAIVSQQTLRLFNHRYARGAVALTPLSSHGTAVYHYIVKTFAVQHGCRHAADDVEGFGRTLLRLCNEVRELLQREPRHGTMRSPCYVFGDLHGNFRDLFYFMDNLISFQDLRYTPHRFLFLGDYVDRGAYSVEVVAYLFAMKVIAPDKVLLLRGNHEDTLVSGDVAGYGAGSFRAQCHACFGAALGEEVWQRASDTFAYLPLSANIDGKIFCAHGGIPRYRGGVDARLDILASPSFPPLRTLFEPATAREDARTQMYRQLAMDVCWADPADAADEDASTSTTLDAHGFGANPRGSGVILFGRTAVDEFLAHSGYEYIFRAHQEKADGLKLSASTRVFTIFSTSAYVGHRNGAGVVLVADDKIRLIVKNADHYDDDDGDESEVAQVHALHHDDDGVVASAHGGHGERVAATATVVTTTTQRVNDNDDGGSSSRRRRDGSTTRTRSPRGGEDENSNYGSSSSGNASMTTSSAAVRATSPTQHAFAYT